jgi:hypothetical protein
MLRNVVHQRYVVSAFRRTQLLAVVCLVVLCGSLGCRSAYSELDDEARRRGRSGFDYLPRTIDNYFKGMDGIVMPPPGFAYQLLSDTSAAAPALALTDPVDTQSEIFGRNTWVIWAGGNEGFWDWLSTTYGFIDLLKLVETPREQRFIVGGRPESAGLINEPGMTRRGPAEFGLLLDVPTDPDIAAWRRDYVRRAFRLDGNCSAAAAATESAGNRYGGSYGSRGSYAYGSPNVGYDTGYGAGWKDEVLEKIPPPQIYGISSGVVGLRLFPNPNFDEEACRKWNAAAYHDDAIGDPNMIRPYRVGMSCGFCHVSWHPLKPPADMLNPKWENISGNIGAQYLRPRAAFGNLLQKDNLIYHVLDSQPPGTIDTSLVASDNINNPNTMNAVFNLPQRAVVSLRNAREKQGGPSAAWPSLWRDARNTRPDGGRYAAPDTNDPTIVQPFPDAVPQSVFNLFNGAGLAAELQGAQAGEINRRTPRVLLDGADSIGAWGALARVYLNIGTNWEQWNSLHAPVVGFRNQKPFSIANAERHSVYFLANELRVPALRDYFLKVTPPMPLLATPGGGDRARAVASASATERRRSVDLSQLERGRRVFAHNCITCHSSIQPTAKDLELFAATPGSDGRIRGRQEELDSAPAGQFWDRDPARWLTDPAYIKWAEEAVEKPEFWNSNYLSTDYRIAINLVQTNACRALATNAMNGHMWEDFASESYRSMPSVGGIPFFNPYKGDKGGPDEFYPRHAVTGAPPGGGGPGFYRVPTLVSIWATAPFLHNNSLGLFNNDPSVNGRLDSFDDSIRKLLTPAKRLESSSYNQATAERLKADHGLIWRTTEDTYVVMPGSYVPKALGSWVPAIGWLGYRLNWIAKLPGWARPLPSIVLALIAVVLFIRTDRLSVRRILAYLLLLSAVVVGTVVYFFNGGFGGIRVGPIPKGMPVNLIANANPEAGTWQLLKLAVSARDVLTEIASRHPTQNELDQLLRTRIVPELLKVSKCPDLVMDHGHEYDWFKRMTDADKDALIELLKTF